MTQPVKFDGAANWSTLGTLARGASSLFRVPAAVLCASSMGFGALARDSGLDLGLTLFINATVFALPGQVVLVDEIAGEFKQVIPVDQDEQAHPLPSSDHFVDEAHSVRTANSM